MLYYIGEFRFKPFGFNLIKFEMGTVNISIKKIFMTPFLTTDFFENFCGKHNLKQKTLKHIHSDPDGSIVLTDIARLLQTYDFTLKILLR